MPTRNTSQLLPAEAYFDQEWFDREQVMVTDRTWHGGDREGTTQTWEGLAFSSTDPASSFDRALGTLPDGLGSVRPSLLTQLAELDLEGRFNWKLFIENHLDVLHLWYLHDRTLASFDHSRFVHRQYGPNWASHEPVRMGVITPPRDVIQHLEQRDLRGLGAHLLFPDTPMAVGAEFFVTYRARPVTPESTIVELRLYGEEHADPGPILTGIRSFIEEDIEACSRIQKTLRSRHFLVGPLARDHERPLMTFQHNLLSLMDGDTDGI